MHRPSAFVFSSALVVFVVQDAKAATTTCRTVAACVMGTNLWGGLGVAGSSIAGTGVKGTSKSNDGIIGITTMAATLPAQGKSGISGYDSSTNQNTFNSGLYGVSAYGTGDHARSTSGFGVNAQSKSGTAVNAFSTSGFGVMGMTTQNAMYPEDARAGVSGIDASTNGNRYNSGVTGTSSQGNGVFGSVTSYGYGVLGVSATNGSGVMGMSAADAGAGIIGVGGQAGVIGITQGNGRAGDFEAVHGEGVVAVSDYNTGLEASSGDGAAIIAEARGGPGLLLRIFNSDGYLLQGVSSLGNQATLSIDYYGNEILAGKLTVNGSPELRTRSKEGPDVTSFGARSSSPTLEDFGKAVLRDGAAYVSQDKTFVSTIDSHAGYMVFLTPEGNSHGLYTSALTPAGFAVHENDGGHASVTFDYRIVAHPADAAETRFPASLPLPLASHATNTPQKLSRIIRRLHK